MRYVTYEAGALVRGQIKREIASAAWQKDLDVGFEEVKGLLSSTVRVRISGYNEASFARGVQCWLGMAA